MKYKGTMYGSQRTILRVGSPLPPSGFLGPNSGCQSIQTASTCWAISLSLSSYYTLQNPQCSSNTFLNGLMVWDKFAYYPSTAEDYRVNQELGVSHLLLEPVLLLSTLCCTPKPPTSFFYISAWGDSWSWLRAGALPICAWSHDEQGVGKYLPPTLLAFQTKCGNGSVKSSTIFLSFKHDTFVSGRV